MGEVYIFIFGKNVCSVLYALPYWHRSTDSICVVAMGAIHFSVCVASIAHTFYFGGKKNEI